MKGNSQLFGDRSNIRPMIQWGNRYHIFIIIILIIGLLLSTGDLGDSIYSLFGLSLAVIVLKLKSITLFNSYNPLTSKIKKLSDTLLWSFFVILILSFHLIDFGAIDFLAISYFTTYIFGRMFIHYSCQISIYYRSLQKENEFEIIIEEKRLNIVKTSQFVILSEYNIHLVTKKLWRGTKG
ncbi:MAG: hypothetical protein ACW99Q_27720, partial [Candidatus Kariarchaeaceae archaeon]